MKRLLTHCPAILWAYLRDVETIEDSWMFHLRASFAWLARFSASHFGLTGDSTLEDWIVFVAADGQWKGRLKRAVNHVAFIAAPTQTQMFGNHGCCIYFAAEESVLGTCLLLPLHCHGFANYVSGTLPPSVPLRCMLHKFTLIKLWSSTLPLMVLARIAQEITIPEYASVRICE